MPEQDNTRLLANLLSMLAVVMTASGVFVSTQPLESKRPVNADSARIFHTGRQDVEARLWQDPFAAVMNQIKGETRQMRCDEARKDVAHQPGTLRQVIEFRGRRSAVTVLPVMVPGGAYFEDGEARRRTRYAVVTALLDKGWVPSDEDKLGYIWTFESCIQNPWSRWAPELLPWEVFTRSSDKPAESSDKRPKPSDQVLLVLWFNEDAIERRPLRGINEIVKLLMRGGIACPGSESATAQPPARKKNRNPDDRRETALAQLAEDLQNKNPADPTSIGACLSSNKKLPRLKIPLDVVCTQQESAAWRADPSLWLWPWPKSTAPRPWCATRVIGPATSEALSGLVKDLADPPPSLPDAGWLQFYSSGATSIVDDEQLEDAIERGKRNAGEKENESATRQTAKELRALLDKRVLRLTATDDILTDALLDELKRRLTDPDPFWRLAQSGIAENRALCGATVVIVAERDSRYARRFSQSFAESKYSEQPRIKDKDISCGTQRPKFIVKSYLRGTDGILPDATEASSTAARSAGESSPAGKYALLAEGARERADGRNQYDYLLRLADDLLILDRQERRDGRSGVVAIGVLGTDAYDRIVALEALRPHFPKAIFFTADLDARMLGADVARWSRNLVVASNYGLTLNPKIQGTAPPFRDTYQTGIYLSTMVALDPSTQSLDHSQFKKWFATPQLFEIGRTRAVALSPGAQKPCDILLPDRCPNVHRLDEWLDVPWPHASTLFAVAIAALSAALLSSLVSRGTAKSLRTLIASGWTVAPIGAVIVALGWFSVRIWRDVSTHNGEPFAWLEGVSLWPTVFIQLTAVMVVVALLVWYLRRLAKEIDKLDRDFMPFPRPNSLPTSRARPGRWLDRIRQYWWLESPKDAVDNWHEFRSVMSRHRQLARVATSTTIAFVFGVALFAIEWPNSPHRGVFAAWSNHISVLLIMLAQTAALLTVLDASTMATRFISRLDPNGETPPFDEGDRAEHWRQSPMTNQAIRLDTMFRLVVRLGTSVTRLVYLPIIALLLVVPARSRVFDAMTVPLAYMLVLLVAVGLGAFCAIRLRRAATRFRSKVSAILDGQIKQYEVELDQPGQAPTAANDARPESPAWSALPTSAKVRRLREVRDAILAERQDPFRPLAESSLVRAILLLLGGSGAITTLQFIFLS